ncbi:hypothetical protein D3C71_1434810 [compost metagenome]
MEQRFLRVYGDGFQHHRRVIHHYVNPGDLLQHGDHAANEQNEAYPFIGIAEFFLAGLLILFYRVFDFLQHFFRMFGVGHFGQHRQRLIVPADHHAPAWRLWNDKYQNAKQDAGQHAGGEHPAPAHLHQPGFTGIAGNLEVNVKNHDLTEHDGELLHAERPAPHILR